MVQTSVLTSYKKQGIAFHLGTQPERIVKGDDGKMTVHFKNPHDDTADAGKDNSVGDVDCVLYAIGRDPREHSLL